MVRISRSGPEPRRRAGFRASAAGRAQGRPSAALFPVVGEKTPGQAPDRLIVSVDSINSASALPTVHPMQVVDYDIRATFDV